MRSLLFFCLASTAVMGKALGPPKFIDNVEMRKTIAFHIVRALPRAPLVFKLGRDQYSVESHHNKAYLGELVNTLATDVTVLHGIFDLLQAHNKETRNVEDLAKNLHLKMAEVANSYVVTQKGGELFHWEWYHDLAGSKNDRLLAISNMLKSSAKFQKDKDVRSSQVLEYLATTKSMAKEEQEQLSDLMALYKEFPSV